MISTPSTALTHPILTEYYECSPHSERGFIDTTSYRAHPSASLWIGLHATSDAQAFLNPSKILNPSSAVSYLGKWTGFKSNCHSPSIQIRNNLVEFCVRS